jgi:hypothetical protein
LLFVLSLFSIIPIFRIFIIPSTFFYSICFPGLLYFFYTFSFLDFCLAFLSFFSPLFFSSLLPNFHSLLLSSSPSIIALNFSFFLGSFFFMKDLLFISDRRIKKIFKCSLSLSTIGLVQHSVSSFRCVLILTLYREVTSFKSRSELSLKIIKTLAYY